MSERPATPSDNGTPADRTETKDGSGTSETSDTTARNAGRRSAAVGAPLGPGSVLWRIAGDPRGLLPGSAAGIMQLMLPGLGAGVTDHSNFFDDPFDRIFRSIPYIWGSIFSEDGDEADRRGRQIRDFHPDIKGTDHHGNRYHALDPDIFWWAHATFTWEFFRARELFFPLPFRRAEQEQLYAETVTWYRRYGVSDRPVPATLDDFRRRFDEICRTELEVTPAVAWVLDPEKNPAAGGDSIRLPGPLSPLSGLATRAGAGLRRALVLGVMPDVVRRRLEVDWSNADRATFLWACGMLRSMDPAIRRGALGSLFPEGTPRTDPRDPTRVMIAGPGLRQGATTRTAAAS
ncbi:MAG: DUF2236 domain-containing protein [Acidimicrobiia bacterium]|nr:DUF2236 domain-containing protein [Acidimicrobiia bacterium]